MHIGQFLDYLRYQRRYSEHTLKAYRIDLDSFSRFLKEDKGFDLSGEGAREQWGEVSHHMIREWILALMNQNLSPRTVHRKLSSVKSFYRYLLRQQIVEQNPASRISAPKQKKRLMRVASEDDLGALIDGSYFENDRWGITQRSIFLTFYHTGMRLAELMNLRMIDVDLAQERVKVTGKRNKQRNIPLTPNLRMVLTEYLEARRGWEAEGTEAYLFITRKGRQLYPKLVYNLIHDLLERVSGIEKKSPHILRHSFATHMLNHGADLNSLKELLGHANLAATQVYTHNSIDELKRVYGEFHPRRD